MAYTDVNYQSKKELKADFAAGKQIHCYQPGGIFPLKVPGRVYLEGPHYPKPHRWYAVALVDSNAIITKVLS